MIERVQGDSYISTRPCTDWLLKRVKFNATSENFPAAPNRRACRRTGWTRICSSSVGRSGGLAPTAMLAAQDRDALPQRAQLRVGSNLAANLAARSVIAAVRL